jgi:enediyne biosynthesis protein E4
MLPSRLRLSPPARLVLPSILLAAALGGCDDGGPALFRDITKSSGMDFVHTVDPTGGFPLPEIMGAGCAVFDADGDGRLDIYFSDAGRFGGKGAKNRLYLRLADGTYREATDSGLEDTGFGMGLAVGDIDNDGDLDVYVGNYGKDALYRNNGKGKFTDITDAAGLGCKRWASSIAFLDYDADGHLDLFLVNYVAFDPDIPCKNPRTGRDYCGPQMFKGESDVLYRNRGDGTFENVSETAGIAGESSNGLGITIEDFNDDGWPDIFVANDAEANHLWINNRDGTFQEDALSLGVAVNGFGVTEASMGVAVGDVDRDGRADLFMTHLVKERNTLYLRKEFGFEDVTPWSGLDGPSFPFTGFGTALFDVEHDGDLDLAVGNGGVLRGRVHERSDADPLWRQYAEPNQLFLGDGSGKFTDVSPTESSFCHPVEITRALAIADLDADGDLDIVVANCRGRARIHENIAPKSGHWLVVRAVDKKLQRDVYGAVIVIRTGERVHRRVIGPANSYLTSSMIAAHFGLGAATLIDRIEVRWPGGEVEWFGSGPLDRAITLTRGQGEPK